MNDRFLCRGKRASMSKKDGDWIIGYYTGADNCVHYIKSDTTEYFSVHENTLGQCTGLSAEKSYRGESKKDRLIFEGDIVKYTHNTGESNTVYIKFDNFEWKLSNTMLPFIIFSKTDIEIIGNIHDNPELLEER